MTAPLRIVAIGAVTPVGLTAAQTCAAIRARVSAIGEAVTTIPEHPALLGARIAARTRLREPMRRWLAALAERGIRDALESHRASPAETALILALPESYRRHPALEDHGPTDLVALIERRLGFRFHPSSRVLGSGHAAAFEGLSIARELLRARSVAYCLVGGADSLLNDADIERLQSAGRIHNDDNPQGVIPGEGSAFVLLSQGTNSGEQSRSFAEVAGVIANEKEADSVLGERYSTGHALERALRGAMQETGCVEADLSLRVSDMNGERYRAWESFIGAARFYKARRDRIPVWYPAAYVGDTGAAAGALSLVIASTAVARGYAPGPIVVCEGSSDEGLRAACTVVAAQGAPRPPFRSRAAWVERDQVGR